MRRLNDNTDFISARRVLSALSQCALVLRDPFMHAVCLTTVENISRDPVKPGRCAARLRNISMSSRANEVERGDLRFVSSALPPRNDVPNCRCERSAAKCRNLRLKALHASHISLPASHIQTVIASEARLSAAIYRLLRRLCLLAMTYYCSLHYLMRTPNIFWVGTHSHIAVNGRRGFDICSQ